MKFVKRELIYINKSKFGQGVFAARDIKKGEKVCKFKGEKIKSGQLNLVIKKNRNILVDPLQIDVNTYLVLDKPYILFNHSCNPNAGIKNNTDMYAIKNIKRDEEIFYDYSTTWLEGFSCKCGSANCRRYISDYYTIPSPTRKKYRRLGIISTFIKN